MWLNITSSSLWIAQNLTVSAQIRGQNTADIVALLAVPPPRNGEQAGATKESKCVCQARIRKSWQKQRRTPRKRHAERLKSSHFGTTDKDCYYPTLPEKW